MQIVIDIPEHMKIAYEDMIKHCNYETIEVPLSVIQSIVNGIPLPENHGDLIDRNELLQEPLDRANYASNFVRIAKAIVPATKGE